MRSKLNRLFERYWITIMLVALWFAVVMTIAVEVGRGASFEESLVRIFSGIAIGLFPFVVKGDEWAKWICQHSVAKPSIKVDVDYRYIIDQNRRSVTVVTEFTGKSRFKIYIPSMFIDLGYESPKEKTGFAFPLDQRTVDVNRTISKGKTETMPIPLTVVDTYFFNDALESHSRNKSLKLLFWLKYSPEVIIFWRFKIPIKHEVKVEYDQIPKVQQVVKTEGFSK